MEPRFKVAVSGPTGAGKTTWANAISPRGASGVHHLITPIRILINRCGVKTPSREGLARVTAGLRSEVGEHALALLALEYPQYHPPVIEGVRLSAEVDYLRANGYTIVYVDSPLELRRARRGLGVSDMPFEGFATDLQALADITVSGDASPGELENGGVAIRAASQAALHPVAA